MHRATDLLVKKEIDKYLKVGFIKAIDYSPWVYSVVPTQKPNRDVRFCIYFRDINKSCPKDYFSLPIIDIIISNVVGYEMLYVKDYFLGYNQVNIRESDQHKITFHIHWGNFC